MTETRTSETNRAVQVQPIVTKMHYICDTDYGRNDRKTAQERAGKTLQMWSIWSVVCWRDSIQLYLFHDNR